MGGDKASLDNTGLAFGLVVAAGLSTAVGAAAVYFQSLVKFASKKVLAAGLGFSGGVMIYVSFVEIMVKSNGAFVDHGLAENDAYYCATACLFAGMFMMRMVSVIVHKLEGNHSHSCNQDPSKLQKGPPMTGEDAGADAGQVNVDMDQVIDLDNVVSDAPGAAPDKAAAAQSDAPLMRMGVKTAIAIGIHNFPEGLATFVATLVDPAVGITLAIAIAIHNIPEGLCVALPIYYSTGSRHKGFLWALFSGLSEPVGAFLGWLIIKSTGDDMNQLVYGILFGSVAGMMIMIVLMELIPTAFKYDPDDKVVTNSLVLGMFVMSMSLCLFMA
jgi:ZIP family zinc transporter